MIKKCNWVIFRSSEDCMDNGVHLWKCTTHGDLQWWYYGSSPENRICRKV